MTDNIKETTGVLLLNLGGPDSLQAVRPFLYNIFSDREIIKLGPSFLQKPIAWMISGCRSPKTEKMYSIIGGRSPILEITKAQAEALEQALNTKDEGRRTKDDNSSLINRPSSLRFKVYIGMRYWHPFIEDSVDKILKDGIKDLIVLSLYPHYSKATTGSAIAEFKRAIARTPSTMPNKLAGKNKPGPEVSGSPLRYDKQNLPTGQAGTLQIRYIEQWYDFPLYIEALAESIYKGIVDFNSEPAYRTGRPVELLFSAHSLPQDFIKKGDPYIDHINATITAVNSLLSNRYSLPIKWHLSFQSRSGPIRWLQPSTDETIIKLSETGCKNLLVVPISFVSDHIETLYEIDILYKELAEKHGINFKRTQSLNTSEKFIDALKELVLKKTRSVLKGAE